MDVAKRILCKREGVWRPLDSFSSVDESGTYQSLNVPQEIGKIEVLDLDAIRKGWKNNQASCSKIPLQNETPSSNALFLGADNYMVLKFIHGNPDLTKLHDKIYGEIGFLLSQGILTRKEMKDQLTVKIVLISNEVLECERNRINEFCKLRSGGNTGRVEAVTLLESMEELSKLVLKK